MKKLALKTRIMLTMVVIAVVSVSASVLTVYSLSKRVIQKQYVKLAEDTLSAFSIVVDQELGNLVSTTRSVILSSTMDEILNTAPASPGANFTSSERKLLNEEVGKLYSQAAFVEGFFLFDTYGRYYMYLRKR